METTYDMSINSSDTIDQWCV